MPTDHVSLTLDEIERDLRALGLCAGDALEVHSALSRVGWVEGGAATVIQALINVVSNEGAVLMSAYPLSPPVPPTAEEEARGIQWKVRVLDVDAVEGTGMGTVARTFCRWPGVLLGRGRHRVAAWGRDADLHRRNYEHLLEDR